MIFFANRALSIIYNFIKSNNKGGYYLIPLNACPVIPLAFLKANVKFKLIDIELETLCINREIIINHLKDKKCEGLVFIYTYAVDYDFSDFFKTINERRPDFHLIEDKCLNKPAFDFDNASQNAVFTLYSTGYGKYLTLNRGGFAITHKNLVFNNQVLAFKDQEEKLLEQTYKAAFKKRHKIYNANGAWLDTRDLQMDENKYRDEIENKLIIVQKTKEKINNIYTNLLPEEIFIKVSGVLVNEWRANIRVLEKDILITELFKNGLFASSHYAALDTAFSNNTLKNSNAGKLHRQIVNLFNDQFYSEDKAIKTCEIVNNHHNRYGL